MKRARSAGFIPAFFSWIQGDKPTLTPANLSGQTGLAGDSKRSTLRAPFPVRIGPGEAPPPTLPHFTIRCNRRPRGGLGLPGRLEQAGRQRKDGTAVNQRGGEHAGSGAPMMPQRTPSHRVNRRSGVPTYPLNSSSSKRFPATATGEAVRGRPGRRRRLDLRGRSGRPRRGLQAPSRRGIRGLGKSRIHGTPPVTPRRHRDAGVRASRSRMNVRMYKTTRGVSRANQDENQRDDGERRRDPR